MAVLAAHDALALGASATGVVERPHGRAQQAFNRYEARIKEVRLLTASPLRVMRDFYCDTIGLELADESDASITLSAGVSQLTFLKADPASIQGNGGRDNGHPMYHFAFNIPQNQIRAARDWQRERTELVPTPAHMRDPAYPDDVRHFVNWNAHSVFFFDPAFNIVEYIARHDLANDAPDAAAFSARSLECISEIGFVTAPEGREAALNLLRERLGLHEYPRGSTPFAMGDQRGLLLVLANKGNLWGDNTPTPVRWEIFETHAIVRGKTAATHMFDGLPYRVQVASAE